jgi:lytic murein transglycosylase
VVFKDIILILRNENGANTKGLIMRRSLVRGSLLLILLAASIPAHAQTVPCRTSGSYEAWLAAFEREAASQGISQRAIAEAAPYLKYDQRIVNIDHGQRVFTQTFLEFSSRMAAAYRISGAQTRIKKYAPVFERIDKDYGVPAAVISSFWGLESDFGANQGKYPTLSSIVSLAYDCRRADKFRPQLIDALRLIQRGDLRPGEMIGSWAGELGQTQMMPTEYNKYAVDFDNNGKRDLIHDAPDVLGSTANYLVGLGWKRSQPWMTEVHVPARLPWDQADLDIQLPRSKWASWGVTLADGRSLPDDNLPASLLLPMGRLGPAFLVYPNFQVYLQWNNSLVYSTTAAYLATRITGAPPLHRGNPPPALRFEQVKELQTLLVRAGYDVGKIDGFLGLKSRQAVKAMQKKYGLPADSYPTEDLVAHMRTGR